MNIGDKFYSDIQGGIEVTVIDTHYCGEKGNSEETLLICVGNGCLFKFRQETKYGFGGKIVKEPEFIRCIEIIENLKNYE